MDTDRLTTQLQALPPELPDPPDRFEQVRERVRRQRRRQVTGAAVGGLAVLALAVPVAAQLLPESSAPPAAPSEDGSRELTPGQTRVTLLSEPVSARHTGTATVELGPRPGAATQVATLLDCVDAGEFFWPGGAGMVCESDNPDAQAPTQVAEHGLVMDLAPGQDEIVLEATEGASWWVTTAYVTTEVTPWGVNAKGETYGVENENGTPDLIAVSATNGLFGYAYDHDLRTATGPQPTSPEDALAQQEANRGKSFSVPVYESDGETVIGEFVIDGLPVGPDAPDEAPATTMAP